jgi:plasmid stability protein
MDATVRNLDENAYRALGVRAEMEGRTVEALINDAIRGYLARPASRRTSSLRLLQPEPFPPGNERLSMEIDEIVYGTQR